MRTVAARLTASSLAGLTMLYACLGFPLKGGAQEPDDKPPEYAGVGSWDALSDLLIKAVPRVLPGDKGLHDYTFEVPAMRNILDKGDVGLWLRMCAQGERPMVAIGGYLCIEQKSPKDRLRGALTVLENRSADTSFIICLPAMLFLSKGLEASPETLATFTAYAREEHDPKKVLLPVFLADASFLAAWAASDDYPKGRPIVQEAALSSAIGDLKKKGKPLPDVLSRRLAGFATATGLGRVTFVQFAPDSTDPEVLTRAIIGLMKDESLDKDLGGQLWYYAALADRVEFIEKNIDLSKVDLTAAQRARFDKVKALKLKKESRRVSGDGKPKP